MNNLSDDFFLFVGYLKANWFPLTYSLFKITLAQLQVSVFSLQLLWSTFEYSYHLPQASVPPDSFYPQCKDSFQLSTGSAGSLSPQMQWGG